MVTRCWVIFYAVEGQVASANFTRYELKFPEPLRIVVQSLEGDADIYFSYTNKKVSFELDKHDASSTTCGLDYIDVKSSPRPSYLGVYGHPSKNMSSYRLLIMVTPDGNFENPEFIDRWSELTEKPTDEGRHGHPVYIDILSGIILSSKVVPYDVFSVNYALCRRIVCFYVDFSLYFVRHELVLFEDSQLVFAHIVIRVLQPFVYA
ncbi:hypothetical protein Q1695_012247 [Nippostrongylus brasiliensis]|nr:hypothetical protein Q1695_012247 [Nippostrongylus brasiliensis]